jgi:hypothetical protein
MAPITVYQDSRSPGRCRSCGARIEWARVVGTDKAIPLDAGGIVIQTQHSLIDGRVVELVDGTHFATCPDAKAWRKKAMHR